MAPEVYPTPETVQDRSTGLLLYASAGREPSSRRRRQRGKRGGRTRCGGPDRQPFYAVVSGNRIKYRSTELAASSAFIKLMGDPSAVLVHMRKITWKVDEPSAPEPTSFGEGLLPVTVPVFEEGGVA